MPRLPTLGATARRLALVAALAAACTPDGPRAIAYDEESCGFCRMTISDRRFGAEVITATGRIHTFDSVECLAAFVLAQDSAAVRGVWVSDWNHPGTFLAADSAEFRRLQGAAGSPMGKGFVATQRGVVPAGARAAGATMRWSDVLAAARHDGALAEATHAARAD
ncbi:NosL family protein (plasmid) [Gemmatirosa kalamazoonensis]|uniref:NosL family protein n=1 Tax=Gemmatirosa kalamazoonensis TaxID=861299 RepID=W0RPA2_9BACT|nr:hypothetical protein [Gemmatirosa kalamazoonensis]AHG92566.1 NosL family protein [Gemmatirosa kalamazoonensis]